MSDSSRISFFAVVAAALLALALAFMAVSIKTGLLQFRDADRVVSVKGLAERTVEADLALWPINFTVLGDGLDALQSDIETQQNLIRSFLLLKGFAEGELQLAMPKITDQHANLYGSNMPPQRYRAEVTVLVRTGNIEQVKSGMQSVGELVKSGVALTQSYEHQPQFIFTELNSIKPEMIAQATQEARAAADQFARDAGAEVGSIRRASQGYFSIEDVDPYTPEIKKVRVVTSVDYILR
ncbi:SIMPL domain-containing protein [Pseudomonas sp. FME51]|uniref:SIMPL domain-containing protein n=1 Tax=Pseudomonas sp. FME51 TaxID=2742609 RepID=UPI001865EDA2|nr:SIMPL domain-containing protein [Pseudomonas sp. FME51]